MGSRTPISVTLLVKNPTVQRAKAHIYYRDIGDYLGKDDKLKKLRDLGSILNPAMELSSISPNEAYDWINQRDNLFETFIPIEPDKKFDISAKSVFVVNSRGLETARDCWIYNFSATSLEHNIRSFIDFYNLQVTEYGLRKDKSIKVEDYVSYDSKKISWSSSLFSHIQRGNKASLQCEKITTGMYRPFVKQMLYLGDKMIHRKGQFDEFFPTPQSKNLVICVSGVGVTKEFSALIVDIIPDLELIGKSQCFPLYYYDKTEQNQIGLFDQSDDEYIRRDGISDFILMMARQINPKITKRRYLLLYLWHIT